MSKESIEKGRLTHIVFRLLQNANKVLDMKDKEKNSEYVDGLVDAYYEVLCTIQSELLFAGQDLSEFGLDIDLEKIFF
ncbi:MAG: transposase [Clostridia bacterium]|nr:transposase [Clostridia bacterium]